MFNHHLSLIIFALLVSACGSDGSSEEVDQPPTVSQNLAPSISSPNSFFFLESEKVRVQLEATDPENTELVYSIKSGGDAALFFVTDSGLLSSRSTSDFLDFETPLDANADNVYQFTLSVSDRVNTIQQNISITINNVGDKLTCPSPGLISIPENTEGLVYTFQLLDPEIIKPFYDFGQYEITINGETAEASMLDGYISGNSSLGGVGIYPVEIIEYFNAENQQNLDDIFTLSVLSTYSEASITCTLDFKIIDIPNEVSSGVKFSGQQNFNSNIGDVDGDGLSEVWIANRINKPEEPWAHEARLIFGRSISSSLKVEAGIERQIRDYNASNSVRLYGTFPSVGVGRFVGNDLIASAVRDMDGDGINEVLITLQTPAYARENAFADRPLAYLMWGKALLNQTDGEINLNEMIPSEGIVFDGLGGMNRRENTSISGDFDSDGIADIIVVVPEGKIMASETSFYAGLSFVVFGDYILNQKSQNIGNIDLLDDLSTLNPNNSVVLLNKFSILNDTQPPLFDEFNGITSQITVLKNNILGETDDLLIRAGDSSQNFSRMAVIDGDVIKDAKGNTAFLGYADLPINKRKVIRYLDYSVTTIGSNSGDVDGDGKLDILIAKSNYIQDTGLADLIYGEGIEQISFDAPFELEEQFAEFGFVRFFNNSEANTSSTAQFISDIDGDGRDDIVISSKSFIYDGPEQDTVITTSINIVLAIALDNLPESRTFNLDDIKAGQGLKLINGEISRNGPTVTVIDDIDGDEKPDLLVSTVLIGKESYIILGKDIMESINAGEVEFDLEKHYRKGE